MPSQKKKRKYILYFAISLLTEYVDLTIPLYLDKEIIEKAKEKINIIYKQIKKNEEAPNTAYLFNNSITGSDNNLEKTIKKLETFTKMTHLIPRK